MPVQQDLPSTSSSLPASEGASSFSRLLDDARQRALRYLDGMATRPVEPGSREVSALTSLGGPTPEQGTDPRQVLALLDDVGSPATVTTAGPRYFGYVMGGALPATLAANWLAGAWDQNVGLRKMSPVGAAVEDIALGWLRDLLHLPAAQGGGFVTGATMANFAGLVAARHRLLARLGWDVEAKGLFGAPEIRVVVGAEVHAAVKKALALAGFGKDRVEIVPADGQGRMIADLVPRLNDRTILCLQAGNVNTGAFDPAATICPAAREAGAWIHVDGAFGLWAAVSPALRHLMDGYDLADSWATDGHKWLNVPYDSGIVLTRDPEALRAAMALNAAYLTPGEEREPCHYTPDSSRRARGVEVWAAIRSLGREGLSDLFERNCHFARIFATRFREAGFAVLNDVVLNQVLVSFGDAETTRRVMAGVQTDGTCWCGGTEWQGHTAMRIAVSSWATTEADVEQSAAAILRIARGIAR